MGKYQLDYKGQASVQKFHEKNSTEKSDKNEHVKNLMKKHLEKKNGKKA